MRAVKIRQLLLLIVRTLLVMALVLAFARPAMKGYLGSFFGSSHANTSMIFLIDNSASMSRSDDHGELLKQAKDAASDIVKVLEDGDDVTIIPLASMGRGAEYHPVHTKRDVLAAINDVRIADRPALLSDGLRMASSVLSSSHNVNKEVYLLSDDQARNLRDENDVSSVQSDSNHASKLFDASTKLFTITLGNGEHITGRNLSLDSLRPVTTVFEPGRPIQFEAWIRNTTAYPAQNVVLSLFYNNDRVAQKTIPSIAGSESQHITLDGPARGSGMVEIRTELEPDALPFDNRRFAVINVPISRRIGIFAQNPSDVTFIKLALDQTLSGVQGSVPFVTELKPLEELRSLSSDGHYDGVFVELGPQALNESDLAGLKEFVSTGHGVAIFLMPGIDPNTVNHDLVTLALPDIIRKEGVPNDATHYLGFSRLEFSHPFFAGMFEPMPNNSAQLQGISSPKIFESYALAANAGLPLIKLSNGSAFLVESKVGKGDILLYNIPPTLAFTDFPRKSIFLPLIRRTAAYASAVESSQAEQNKEFVTTEPFNVPLPDLAGAQAGATVLIQAPDGTSSRAPIAISPDAKPQLRFDDARVAGNYTVFRDAAAQEPVGGFAVNIQSDESDLRAASLIEMKQYLAARMYSTKPSIIRLVAGDKDLSKTVEQSRYGVELWQSFLWAALILALIELLIAREARGKASIAKTVSVAALFFAMIVNIPTSSAQKLPDGNANRPLTRPEVSRVPILPSVTDPGIKTFDNPHWLFVNRDIIVDHKPGLPQDRHELYLFIPGTHVKDTPRGSGPSSFCKLAADLGYHVIVLSYPDEVPASVCRNDNDPNSFEAFRLAIIQGGSSDHITVERPESIENRLIKLLHYVEKIRPREHWGQFLNSDGSIKWESIAVGGHSQGGGHALLIGIKHRVTRVICTGSPKDFNHNRNAPPAFYAKKSATPKDHFFAFNHSQDFVGGTSPEQLLKNLDALGLDAFGQPANVDAEPFPYHHARILTTSFPTVDVTGPQSGGSIIAHSSTLDPQNADRWRQVWEYMLTETTP